MKRAVALVVVVAAFGAILQSAPSRALARRIGAADATCRAPKPSIPGDLDRGAVLGMVGGGTESAVDRTDAVAGAQIHVIYAYPSDSEDRFDVWAPRITRELAAGDQWWRGQDPTRTLRFDMAEFAGCTTGFGQLDISSVRIDSPRELLPESDHTGTTLHDALAAELPAGPGKIYLVFLDGDDPDHGVCGRDFRDAAVVFLGAEYLCPTYGKTAVHELLTRVRCGVRNVDARAPTRAPTTRTCATTTTTSSPGVSAGRSTSSTRSSSRAR